MFRKVLLVAALGALSLAGFSGTASAHGRERGRLEYRGNNRSQGLYQGERRFGRREAFQRMRRHPAPFFRRHVLRGWFYRAR